MTFPIARLRKEAKKLLGALNAGDGRVRSRLVAYLGDTRDISLMNVHHVLALELGFKSWTELVTFSDEEIQRRIDEKRAAGIEPATSSLED